MKKEFLKISWPSFPEAAKLSAIALGIALIVSAFCFVVDSGVTALLKGIFA